MGQKGSCYGNVQWVPHSGMVPRKDRMQLPWQLHLLWRDRYCPVALATAGFQGLQEAMANSLGSLSQWITVVCNCLSAPLCILVFASVSVFLIVFSFSATLSIPLVL